MGAGSAVEAQPRGRDEERPGTAAEQAAERAQAERDEAEEARQDAAVEAYARDHEGLEEENERDALDFVLAPKAPRLYDVKVDYDTEAGVRPLTFVIRPVDGRKIDEMEQRHRSETTGLMDQISYDCELVGLATAFLEDRSGRQVKLDSREFLTVRVPDPDNEGALVEQEMASAALALEARFRTQLGLLFGVAREIRRVSGYDPTRIGSANRRIVAAMGNS